ncbi:MAG: hypothetical protein AB1567_07100 [bacterium]
MNRPDNDNTHPVSHVRWSMPEISPSGTATFVLKVKVEKNGKRYLQKNVKLCLLSN